MAKGNKWKNFWKGIFNNGFYYNNDNGWSAFDEFTDVTDDISDSFGDDAADVASAGNVVDSLINKATDAGLTGAQREANAFSAQEAERSRAWTEEMYEKYNSLSGKIAQAEKAGVNPMLAVTGNAVSPMGSASSSPSSVSPTGHGLTDLFGTIMGFMKIKSEINLMDSEAQRNRADANKTDKETSWIDSLSQAQLDNLVASKEELQSRLGVNDATANKLNAEFSKLIQETARIAQISDAEKKNLEAQTALANFQRESANTFKGLDVGSDVLNTVIDLAIALIERKTHLTLGR